MPGEATPLIEWAVADEPMRGEHVSGDAAVVETWADGALVAVIDALGHGPEAEKAARVASQTIRSNPSEAPARLVEQCHQALRKMRGTAMTLASLSARDDSLVWLGIGNVEAVLFRADSNVNPRRESVLLRGGIVGGQIPTLRPTGVPLRAGDVLVMATDGISSKFATQPDTSGAPREVAERILRDYGKGIDDALVLVARYLGGRP